MIHRETAVELVCSTLLAYWILDKVCLLVQPMKKQIKTNDKTKKIMQ